MRGRLRKAVIAVTILYGVLSFTFQFVTGAPLLPRKTDSSFFKRGTTLIRDAPQATWWSYMPGWKRAAVRVGTVFILWQGLHFYLTDRAAFYVAIWILVGAVVVALVTVLLWRSFRGLRAWQHRRTYITPLHKALSIVVGRPLSASTRWISVPKSMVAGVPLFTLPEWRVVVWFRTWIVTVRIRAVWARRPELPLRRERSGEPVTIALPETYPGGRELNSTVERVVTSKLGLADVDAVFHMVGSPRATFSLAPRPPGVARWDDYLPVIESALESAPIIGIGSRDSSVSVDLDADSPHVMISAGSGGGKSVMGRLITAQGLHNGGVVLILDIKRVSHAWARGLSNVRYCRNISEIHDGLLWIKAEVDRRYDLIDAYADVDGNVAVDIGPRVYILAEEMNATINRLSEYWKETRDKGDPPASPAVKALGDVLFMGRQSRTHVIAIAQLMTARTLGGPEARENFATRILARYSANAWRMLVPEIWPMPKGSRHSGRVQVALAGTARETQVIFSTPGEARAWAQSGAVTPFPGAVSSALGPSDLPGHPGTVPGTGDPGALPTPPVPAPRVTLREVAELQIVPMRYEALKKAAQRDPEFPGNVERGSVRTYERADMVRWYANRPRPNRP